VTLIHKRSRERKLANPDSLEKWTLKQIRM